jgi:SHS2 domain-containing protein
LGANRVVPFRFREDIAIADVAFDAWGETREELFAACADALLRTMVEDPGAVGRGQEREIRLEGDALDMLLFAFLSELVFDKDSARRLVHADAVRIDGDGDALRLSATVRGELIDPARHRLLVDVKAVTLHRFRVAFEDNHWKATVVLDV